MGAKITIDSATLMNKGLEIIEAMRLYRLPVEQVEAVIHRQSIVHSLVEYRDGAMIAQLGTADMKLPIRYAFTMALPGRNTGPDAGSAVLRAADLSGTGYGSVSMPCPCPSVRPNRRHRLRHHERCQRGGRRPVPAAGDRL